MSYKTQFLNDQSVSAKYFLFMKRLQNVPFEYSAAISDSMRFQGIDREPCASAPVFARRRRRMMRGQYISRRRSTRHHSRLYATGVSFRRPRPANSDRQLNWHNYSQPFRDVCVTFCSHRHRAFRHCRVCTVLRCHIRCHQW